MCRPAPGSERIVSLAGTEPVYTLIKFRVYGGDTVLAVNNEIACYIYRPEPVSVQRTGASFVKRDFVFGVESGGYLADIIVLFVYILVHRKGRILRLGFHRVDIEILLRSGFRIAVAVHHRCAVA